MFFEVFVFVCCDVIGVDYVLIDLYDIELFLIDWCCCYKGVVCVVLKFVNMVEVVVFVKFVNVYGVVFVL